MPIIYPFGFNISQKEAVANAILRDCKVATVSNNNSAIQNIEEKLQKYSLDFFVAKLGNNHNKITFIENQKIIPNITKWKCDEVEWRKICQKLKKNNQDLDIRLFQQNELSYLKQTLASIKIEQQHFEDYLTLNTKAKVNCLDKIKY